jgi:glutamate synthase (NADPH/NADH) small chain
VIVAIGNRPNPLLPRTVEGLATQSWGGIIVSPAGQTSLPQVFAGGDIVTGGATVIEAMGAGKRAARAMDRFLRGEAV